MLAAVPRLCHRGILGDEDAGESPVAAQTRGRSGSVDQQRVQKRLVRRLEALGYAVTLETAPP